MSKEHVTKAIEMIHGLRSAESQTRSVRQLIILTACYAEPGIKNEDLARIAQTTEQGICGSGRQLRLKGLISTETQIDNKSCRKTMRHYLTDKGNKTIAKLLNITN